MADKESKEIAQFKRLKEEKGSVKQRAPNPMLFGMEPPEYVLWVLRSVKSVDLEPSLLVLPLSHVERLMHYLILLLRAGKGIELCAKISVFLVKSHQAQVNKTMFSPWTSILIPCSRFILILLFITVSSDCFQSYHDDATARTTNLGSIAHHRKSRYSRFQHGSNAFDS